MAGDGGLNALSLLLENVLPQWQQKIALRAENSPRPHHQISGAGWIFCTKCDFLQVLDLLIFRQKQPGHWAEVVCHFHLTFNVVAALKISQNKIKKSFK